MYPEIHSDMAAKLIGILIISSVVEGRFSTRGQCYFYCLHQNPNGPTHTNSYLKSSLRPPLPPPPPPFPRDNQVHPIIISTANPKIPRRPPNLSAEAVAIPSYTSTRLSAPTLNLPPTPTPPYITPPPPIHPPAYQKYTPNTKNAII